MLREAVGARAEEGEEAEVAVAEDLGGRRDPSTRDARSGRLSSLDSRLLAERSFTRRLVQDDYPRRIVILSRTCALLGWSLAKAPVWA